MPPKARITKDMILKATFELIREEGIERVNARSIAKKLNCSTQPVMYYFETIEDIKRETYNMVDEFHTKYVMTPHSGCENPMTEIGLAYVHFASEEKNLFRFLFQSDQFSKRSLKEVIDDPLVRPVLEVLADTLKVDVEEAKQYFVARLLVVHGMASMLANNSMVYDEPQIISILNKAYK